MSKLININQLTMSSREIAELTGKLHNNVMRDIRAMLESLQNSDLNPVCNSVTYTGENGQQYSMYELDKDTTLTLLLGYDAVARMRVVKRWQELENQQKPKIPKTYSEALLEAGRLAAENERLEVENLELKEDIKELEVINNKVVKKLKDYNSGSNLINRALAIAIVLKTQDEDREDIAALYPKRKRKTK